MPESTLEYLSGYSSFTRPNLLAGQQLPPPPQQERSRRKREALLRAALELFAEHGYERASVEAIARRAGVAVGAFYQHFTSKRQILLVLMDRLLEEVEGVMAPTPGDAPGTMRSLIRSTLRQGLTVDWAYRGAYRAWREAALIDEELRGLQLAVERWAASRLIMMLRALQMAPHAREVAHIEALGWALSLLFWRLAEEELSEPDTMIETLTDMIFHALFEDAAE
jgi:AcrR family transcriptional regulator